MQKSQSLQRVCEQKINYKIILQEYCLNRTQLDSKEDLPNGGTWTNNGYHHFVFDKFYHNHLMRKRWDLGYSRTAEMLREI